MKTTPSHYRLLLLGILSVVLLSALACNSTSAPPTPTPPSTATETPDPFDVSKVFVSPARPTSGEIATEVIEIDNCGGTGTMEVSLSSQTSYENSINFGAAVKLGAEEELALPGVAKAKLTQEINLTYQRAIQRAQSRTDSIKYSVAHHSHVNYRFNWESSIYASTAQYKQGGELYSVPYTFTIFIPRPSGSVEVVCPPTPIFTFTPGPTFTPTSTPISVDTATPTTSPTASATATPTNTPIPSTSTAMPTATETSTPTNTPIPVQPSPTPSDMVYVPAGNFLMGSLEIPVPGQDRDPDPEADEFPQRTVYLPDFWIDRTEVTNAAFRECVQTGSCMADSGRDVNYTDNPATDTYPATYVSWEQAEKYCQWRGKRLPTETEWEKAARGTDGRLWPWGNALKDDPTQLVQRANVGDAGIGDRTPVGAFPRGASPYGALDMTGNVWEWVQDWYKFDYYQNRPDPDQSPPGPSQVDSTGGKVIRGGSFKTVGVDARTTERNGVFTGPAYDIGFRCVK